MKYNHCHYLHIDLSLIKKFFFRKKKMTKRKREEEEEPIEETNKKQKVSILFQQTDTDYYITKDKDGENVPVIRIYGRSDDNKSVLCNVWGFEPYFYIPCPENKNLNLQDFMESMKTVVQSYVKDKDPIKKWGIFEKIQMKYYTKEKHKYIKIITSLPNQVPKLRKIFESGIEIQGYGKFQSFTFESNIPFVLRYIIDRNMHTCSWYEIKNYSNVDEKSSFCDYEVNVGLDDIISHGFTDKKYQSIANIKILSFDIECFGDVSGKKIHFPKPDIEKCSIITISNVIKIYGSKDPWKKVVFQLGKCSNIKDVTVKYYNSEKALLREWTNFIMKEDPDILTGYNINNFDIPYIIDRTKFLRIGTARVLGKLRNQYAYYKKKISGSKQTGNRATCEITLHGRIILDVMTAIQKEYKLSSYTLNNVSALYLKHQKDDVHYTEIPRLQLKNEETRKKIASYCVKDAILPQELNEVLMIVEKNYELSRVAYVPMTYTLTRGQQITVVSQLLYYAKDKDFIMPTVSMTSTKEFKGATVVEPKIGLYDKNPITTLDFASLYPSIMIAHNLCFTTLIPPKEVKNYDPKDYEKSPAGHCFVKKHIRRGLLPEILENLLLARKVAKKELANETDKMKQMVLNARQLALKIKANSVYGFTGATKGQLPCVEISESVTAYGREMLGKVEKWILSHFNTKAGYKNNAYIIYGDTDSVMINFGTTSLEEAMKFGKIAAEGITKEVFVKPISLEFEKCYFPYLLLKKKRYAGLWWTNTTKFDKMDMKGIEAVRRDNCQLIRTLIKKSLEIILIERSVPKAVAYVKKNISDLLQNKIDLSQLVITKSISKEDYKSKQVHIVLAEKMKQRDPDTAPKVGDRVKFVYVCGRGDKDCDKGEDPRYVLKHRIPIDNVYYLQHKFKNALERLFINIVPKNVLNSIFIGDHTKRIIKPKINDTGGMMKFLKVIPSCVECKKPAKSGPLCITCEPKKKLIYEKIVKEKEDLIKQKKTMIEKCRKCRDGDSDITCANDDCEIFYKRDQVLNDIEDCDYKLKRFL